MSAGILLMLAWACQPAGPKNVVLLEGPEIELMMKNIKSYEQGDWAAYRAAYLDTAKSHHNAMTFTVDSLVAFQQEMREEWDKIEHDVYAMEYLKFETGDEWGHFWGKWKGTLAGSGKVIEIPVHAAWHMIGGKIAEEHLYFDPTPAMAAVQETMESVN